MDSVPSRHPGNPVPKLIHQTANSTDLPEPLRNCVESFESLNPGYEIRLHTEQMRDVACAEYELTRDWWDGIPRGVCRADVWRLAILYYRGGIYADIDCECLFPLDDLLRDLCLQEGGEDVYFVEEHPANLSVGNEAVASNFVIVARPGSLLLREMILSLKARGIAGVAPVGETGPGFITDFLAARYPDGFRHVLLPYKLCNPIPDLSIELARERYARELRSSEYIEHKFQAFVCHHWWHSWMGTRVVRNRTELPLMDSWGERLSRLVLRRAQPQSAGEVRFFEEFVARVNCHGYPATLSSYPAGEIEETFYGVCLRTAIEFGFAIIASGSVETDIHVDEAAARWGKPGVVRLHLVNDVDAGFERVKAHLDASRIAYLESSEVSIVDRVRVQFGEGVADRLRGMAPEWRGLLQLLVLVSEKGGCAVLGSKVEMLGDFVSQRPLRSPNWFLTAFPEDLHTGGAPLIVPWIVGSAAGDRGVQKLIRELLAGEPDPGRIDFHCLSVKSEELASFDLVPRKMSLVEYKRIASVPQAKRICAIGPASHSGGEEVAFDMNCFALRNLGYRLDVYREPGDLCLSGDENFLCVVVHLQPEQVVDFVDPLAELSVSCPIFFYWTWEVDSVPDRFDRFASVAQGIIVPSTYVRDVFASCAWDTPIFVVPRAVPVSTWPPTLDLPLKARAEDTLYLVLADGRSRLECKNPLGAIQAFRLAFEGETGGLLILKTQFLKPSDRRRLQRLIGSDDRIHWIDERMNSGEIRALYRMSDVFISLHRSEGGGQPILEAQASGCIVVASDWGGCQDWLSPDNGFLVPGEIVSCPDPSFGSDASWFEPDIAAGSDILREIHQAGGANLLELKKVEAKKVAAEFSPNRLAERFRSLLEDCFG